MKIYLVSVGRLLRFSAIGLGLGFWIAYGAGGLPIGHWWATTIVIITVLYVSAQMFHVIIFNKNGIAYLSYFAVVITPYINIKSLSIQGRNPATTRVVLWPTESRHDISAVDDKVSIIIIELLRENRKRRIPLRVFGHQDRTKIVQTLLEQIKQNKHA